MSSWIGLLVLLVAAYLVVLMVRGLIQFVPWFMETFVEPRQLARARRQPRPDDQPTSSHRKESITQVGFKDEVAFTVLGATSRLTDLFGSLKGLFTRRDFAYWVASALGETDPDRKVKACSRALQLNPAYEPAWGMKANTLLELRRYEEAVPCFDKVLEMRPNSMAWYRKGLCCYHLGHHEEAIACFDKSLAGCADTDRQLFDDTSRHRKLAEEALSKP